jgi:hypothetical protein
LTTTSETTVFRHLRDSEYPAKSFDTGHPAYDRFLAGAKEWQPDWRALEGTTVWGFSPRDAPDAYTREVVLREMPFVAAIEAEPAESLGRAMLINAYAVPKISNGWFKHPSELQQKIQFAQTVFYAFARQQPHARLNAADAEALLREIPVALMQDELVLFTELFFRSFSRQLPASLQAVLNSFFDGFFEQQWPWGVLDYPNAEEIIARHLQFMTLLGRAPESLPFYRERSRVFEIARQRAAWVLPELGPLHARHAAATENGKRGLHQVEARRFEAAIEKASPSVRGQLVTDQCRALLARFGGEDTDRWRNAGLPFSVGNLKVPQLEHLVDQVEREMQLTPEQACIVLEYMALNGEKWASNYPTLSYRVARTLAKYLPTARPDLECLVKDTTYQTDQPTKEILLDALRGEQRGFVDNLLRRLLWKLFDPNNRPEMLGNLWRFFARDYELDMWDEWIAEKRRTLLAQIDNRQPIGRASPQSAAVPGWGAVNGQLYDVDVVGYAKRIARAQSGGADVSVALADLRRLTAMARENLAVLEALVEEVAVSPPLWSEGDATLLPEKSDAIPAKPSLFGLQEPPTNAQLIDFEQRTLAVLDGLTTRIELIRRCPDLVLFEHLLRNPSKDEPRNDLWEHRVRKAWIDARMQNGVPDGVLQRVDGIDFDILDGPYLFDTEPNYTRAEFASWRGAIWALSYIPEQAAILALQRVAAKCFARSLRPNYEGWNYARQGYRAEDLGKAAIWALQKLPGKAGLSTLSDLLARAYPEPLREILRDATKRVESGEALANALPPGFYPAPIPWGR